MKKFLTAMMLAMPLTACDSSQALREENQKLVQENQDLKIRIARLEERAKVQTTAAATPAKAKPKAVATKAPVTKTPDEASPAEKEALTQAATGGGSFK